MGRKPTGRTTKVVRVPNDCEIEAALRLYYDFLPTVQYWNERANSNPNSPRYWALRQALDESGIADLL